MKENKKIMFVNTESYPSDSHFLKGEKLVDRRKYVEAIKEFKKSIKKNPESYNGYAVVGSLYALMENFEESLGWFDQAITRYPEAADLWYNKALSLKKLSRFVEAEQAVIKSLEFNTGHFAALTLKGLLRTISGEAEEALKYFDKALEINPMYEIAWKNKISTLENLGNLQEVKRVKDEILKKQYGIHPITIPEWENQGIDFLKLGTIVELTPDVTYERSTFIIALYNLSPDSVLIIPTVEYEILFAIERTSGAFAAFLKKYNVKAIKLRT